jgi:RNA polymerase sigma factor (sigma-70 family)
MSTKKFRTTIVRTEAENLEREELIRKAADGDEIAFETYYKQNINLLRSIVNRCHRQWPRADVENIYQEGLMGLLHGMKKYKSEKRKTGRPESYLFSWVRAYARRYCVQNYQEESNKVPYDEIATSGFTTAEDRMEYTERYGDFEIQDALEKFFNTLNPRDQVIARGRLCYDTKRTLNSIGRELGVSRERIRQITIGLVSRFKIFAERHDVDVHWT